MFVLNILIYDYTQKAQFDYTMAGVLLLFLAVGITLIKAGKTANPTRLRPGLFTMVRLMLLRGNPKKNRLYGRIAIGFCVFLSVLYTYNFLEIKKPALFNDVTRVTGRLEQVEEKNNNGTSRITFKVNKEDFMLTKDKGYIGSRKLTNGDSIALDYIIDSNPRLTAVEKKRLVRLEVVEKLTE